MVESTKAMCLVTEYCNNGALMELVSDNKRVPEHTAKNLVKSILLAVNYCHQNGVVHRDLKPDNIMFHGGEVKIIDFGFAERVQEGQFLEDAVGTPRYIAPEVLDKKYTSKCDLWSIGVITYNILAGYRPFEAKNRKALFASIRSGQYPLCGEPWDDISEEAKHFISQLLVVDQDKRLSAEQALKHPWISHVDTDANSLDYSKVVQVMFNQMKSFKAETLLQQAIYAYITTNLLDH